MEEIIDPSWYSADLAEALIGKDWDYAISMGKSAGTLSMMSWAELEPILHRLWNELEEGYPPWDMARLAIYRTWRSERRKRIGTPPNR